MGPGTDTVSVVTVSVIFVLAGERIGFINFLLNPSCWAQKSHLPPVRVRWKESVTAYSPHCLSSLWLLG